MSAGDGEYLVVCCSFPLIMTLNFDDDGHLFRSLCVTVGFSSRGYRETCLWIRGS